MGFNRAKSSQAPVQEPAPTEKGKAPVHTISLPAGKGAQVQASIWENQVQNGEGGFTTYSITIVRRYRDGDAWKSASGFRTSDLLLVSKIAEMAFDALLDQKEE